MPAVCGSRGGGQMFIIVGMILMCALVPAFGQGGGSGSLDTGNSLFLGSASWSITTDYGQAQFLWDTFNVSISYSGVLCRNPSWQVWVCPSAYFSKTLQGCIMIGDRSNGSTGMGNPGLVQWPFFFLYNDNSVCSFDYTYLVGVGTQYQVANCMTCLWWLGNQTSYNYCGSWMCGNTVCWCNDLIAQPCLLCPPWAAPLGPNALPAPTNPNCPKVRRDYVYQNQPYYLGAAAWDTPVAYNTTWFQWPPCGTLQNLAHGGYCEGLANWALWACPSQLFGAQYGCLQVTNSSVSSPGGATTLPPSNWPQYFLTNENPSTNVCPFTFAFYYPGSTSYAPTTCSWCLWSRFDPTANASAICGVNQPVQCNGIACWCASGQVAYCPYYCPPWSSNEDAGKEWDFDFVNGNNETKKFIEENTEAKSAKIVLQD